MRLIATIRIIITIIITMVARSEGHHEGYKLGLDIRGIKEKEMTRDSSRQKRLNYLEEENMRLRQDIKILTNFIIHWK